MTGGLERWLVRGLVLGVAGAGFVSACSSDPSPPQNASGTSGIGGGGQSGTATNGGTAVAGHGGAQAGNAMSGSPPGGSGGTAAGSVGGGGNAQGGQGAAAGHAGASTSDGGAGGAELEPTSGGADGTAGAGPECDTKPVAQPRPATCAVAPDVTQEYQVGLATEVLSFGVRLRATGYFGVVHLNEVEVQYYYSQEETSGFQPSVDSFILQPGGLDLTASSEVSIVALDPKQNSTSGPGCQTHFVRIRNSSPVELPPGAQAYAEVHVTLTPKNAAPPNQNHADDHSFVADATAWTQTSLLGVFHCGQLTSGCTPGDAGTCN
jgi:hypothetical protein